MDQTRRNATLDWTTEDEYWRTNFKSRPYSSSQPQYDQWQPAYRYGYESAERYPKRKWDDVESDLQAGWDTYAYRRPGSTWEHVKGAVRDAWDRMTGHK